MNVLTRYLSLPLAILFFAGITACDFGGSDTTLPEVTQPSLPYDWGGVDYTDYDPVEPFNPTFPSTYEPWNPTDFYPLPPTPIFPPLSRMSFSPYVGTQDSNLGACVPPEQLYARLRILKGYAERVRISGMTCGLEEAASVAQELGFSVSAGVTLDQDEATNEAEIEKLIHVGLAGHADVLIVGSDTLHRGDLTESDLIEYIERVSEAVPGVIVTTSEVYQNWIDHPNLANAVDVLYANYHPYWQGIAIEQAMTALHIAHQRVLTIAGGKEVVVSKTGWPSCGHAQEDAVATPENATRYFMEFVTWAEANGVSPLYFEAFDEPWKSEHEGPQGACWGVFTTDGDLKPGMLAVFAGERSEDTWSAGY